MIFPLFGKSYIKFDSDSIISGGFQPHGQCRNSL